MSDEQPAVETTTYMDSDALLVGQYVTQISVDELRRYVAMDLVTALQPLTKDSIKTAKEIEAFLQGKGVRAVE